MQRKHKILILVAVVLVGGTTVAYFGGREILKRRIDGWRTQGMAAAAAGDHYKASELLAQYLRRRAGMQQSEQYKEALAAYAKSRELAEEPGGQHIGETIFALRTLVGLDPDRVDERRRLLELNARVGRRQEALDVANAILAKLPDDVPTLRIKTDLLLGSRNLDDRALDARQYREALETAEHWAALAPGDLQAHLDRLLARQRVEQSPEQILGEARKVQAARPDDATSNVVMAYAYRLTKNRQKATEQLAEAAKRPGLAEDVARALVTEFDQWGMVREAVEIMQERAKSGSTGMRDLLARRMWELQNWPGVIEATQGVDLATGDATLVAFRAIAASNLKQAAEFAKKADEAAKNAEEVARARAALAGRNQAAARAWAALLEMAFDRKKVDEKKLIADCRSALALDPKNVYVAYQLGEALARAGETDIAIKTFAAASRMTVTWPVPTVRLVDALLQRGRPLEALKVVGPMADRAMSPQIAVTLARAWGAAVDAGVAHGEDELLALVTGIQRQAPGEPITAAIRAALLANGDAAGKAEAAALIKAELAREPLRLGEDQLFTLAAVSKKHALGVEAECYARAEKVYGVTPMLAFARAVDRATAATKPDGAAGLATFDELATKAGKPQELPWKMARARYLEVAGHPGAAAAWKDLAAAYPDDLGVQQAVASASGARADRALQESAVERLKALTGETGLAWRMAKARLLVDQARNDADYEQASVLLERILREEPALAEARALMGRALAQMKRTDGAVDNLTIAVQLDPTNVQAALQLAGLHQGRGEADRAARILDGFAPILRTPVQRRQAAVLYAQMGKTDQATKLLEQHGGDAGDATAATQPSTQPGGDDLLLATLYAQRRDFEKADAVLERLLAQPKPTLGAVQFASTYYAGRGQADEAEKVLALLDGMTLDPGVKEVVLATHYGRVGDVKKAEEFFKAATEKAPGNEAAWRALAGIRFGTGRSAEGVATVAAAATAVPKDESFKILNAKASLVRQSADDAQAQSVVIGAVRDPQTTATAVELLGILADWRGTGDTERAAAQLQQFADRNPTYLPGRLQLVACYGAMGRTNDAITAAQQVAAAFPTDPAPAKLAVELSMSAGDWHAVRSTADVWRKRLGTDPLAADAALARADIAQRDYNAALLRMAPYLAKATEAPDKYPDVIEIQAVAETNAGKGTAGADRLWGLAQQSPGWRFRWLEAAAAVRDPAQAVGWLDRAATVLPAGVIAEQVALAEGYERVAAATAKFGVDGKPKPDPAIRAKASAVFAKVCEDPKVPLPAVMAAATHAERVGDLDLAEKLYDRALAMNKDNWLVQNNLAVLLSRRPDGLGRARELAEAAAKAQPRMATVRETLASIQVKGGDPKGAADNMQLAVRLDPDTPLWRVRHAQYLLAAGDRVAAAKALADLDDRRLTRELPADVKADLAALREELKPKDAKADSRG